MATRSTIALQYADGTVGQVYCHWDGYLDNNGKILQDAYTDPFTVRELLDRGDMSTLSEDIKNCEFYTARGERIEDTRARHFASFTDYVRNGQQEEYDYILQQVGGKAVWFVRCSATDGEWVTLKEAAQAEKNANEMEY